MIPTRTLTDKRFSRSAYYFVVRRASQRSIDRRTPPAHAADSVTNGALTKEGGQCPDSEFLKESPSMDIAIVGAGSAVSSWRSGCTQCVTLLGDAAHPL
jgi:hypothetical protein